MSTSITIWVIGWMYAVGTVYRNVSKHERGSTTFDRSLFAVVTWIQMALFWPIFFGLAK